MNPYPSTAYIQANRSLEIPDIVVRKFIHGQATSFNRTRLDVFYIPEFDVFMLHQKDFSYILSRNTFVMIILFQDPAHRSYMLPNVDGHYVLELKPPQNPAMIDNFETILRNYGRIEYRSGQEQPIAPVQPQVQVQQKSKNYIDWSSGFSKASKFLKDGGETVKYHLVNKTNKIGTKETENINPNQVVTEKTIEELKVGNGMVYLPRDSMGYLFATNRQIEAMSQSQIVMTQNAQPVVQGSAWNELKRATLDSATNVWQGMEGAATNLYQALKIKTAKKTNKNVQYQQQYPQQYPPQYQQHYQQQANPAVIDSTRDPFSRSQSGLIAENYQPLQNNSPNAIPTTTVDNTVVYPSIPANNGLYPYLSGPYGVGDARTENNGLNYVPYAQSQVFISPEPLNGGKK